MYNAPQSANPIKEFGTRIREFGLSDEDLEVLQLSAQDKTPEEIARVMLIPAYQVAQIQLKLNIKLKVKTAHGLMAKAIRYQLI